MRERGAPQPRAHSHTHTHSLPLPLPPTHTHPRTPRSYLGEILFWLGTFLGGAPAFGTQPLPWLTGGLGLASILMIMLGATRRLEAKQEKKYGGQQLYQDWRRTTSSLAGPF